MPVFAEDTRWVEWLKKFEKAPAKVSELSRQKRRDMPNIIEERLTNGGFTMTGETVYMEFRRKLFRWRRVKRNGSIRVLWIPPNAPRGLIRPKGSRWRLHRTSSMLANATDRYSSQLTAERIGKKLPRITFCFRIF